MVMVIIIATKSCRNQNVGSLLFLWVTSAELFTEAAPAQLSDYVIPP